MPTDEMHMQICINMKMIAENTSIYSRVCVFGGCVVAGVSGVSRLSSSRSISSSSSSINEHYCSWSEIYQPCHIETTRVEKLAQPMKALITDVQNISTIKRKMKKREFFKNYEKQFKNNANMRVENVSEAKTIESTSDVDICEDSNKLCKARRQLQEEMNEKELVRDVQYSKTADIRFAQKINLPVECKITERNIYNVNYKQNQNLVYPPTGIETSMSNKNQFADVKIYNKCNKPNVKSTGRATTLSEDIINNRSLFQTESTICNSCYNNSDEVTNYVNELEIFVNNVQNTVESTEENHTIELQLNDNVTEEHQFNIVSSKENSLDSTLKAPLNETDYHKNRQEWNEYNNSESLCVIDSDASQSVNRYVNELEVSLYRYSDVCSNEEQKEDSKQKLVIIEKGDYKNNNCSVNNPIDSKFIQVEIINNLDDKNSFEATNYVNEVEFLVCDHSHFLESDTTVNSITEDPLKLSLTSNTTHADKTRQDTSIWNIQKVDLASREDISKKLQFEKNEDCKVNKMLEKDSLVYSHSTPLDTDDIEKNPLDVSLNIFLANEKDSVLEKSFENTTGKEEDISIDSRKKKSDNNGNLWLSMINDSSNFREDTLDQSREIFKSVSHCLDFTYSDIDKYSEDYSPASTTHFSFFGDEDEVVNQISRRDSLVEVVSSINVDIKPTSKLTVDTLADTENSVKYNLDSQNMSLIYSITPPNDIGDSSKNTTITEDILEDNEEEYETFDNYIDNEDANLINLLKNTDKKKLVNMNKTTELSEASFLSNFSNQGSDILELPSHTYLDLQKSSDEIFHKNMSSSVNQILTELNDAEVFVTAENFVDQIIDYVACLDLRRNTAVYSKEELKSFIRKKVSSLNFARKLAKDLVGNLPCYNDANNSTNLKVSNTDESSRLESLDQTVYVIREIIHHVVDKDSLGNKCDVKSKKTVTDKKVKESMNIELKGLKDDYDVEDEQSLKCSTPKMLLSPVRSRNSSFSEEHISTNFENDTENHEIDEDNVTASSKSQQSSDTAVSSHFSPSTESQNFAEQEITSESTDNDTKSDNSKEKPSDSGNIQKNQCISANLHSNPLINTNHHVCSEDQECQNVTNKISFCVIECSNEEHLNLRQDLHNDILVDKKDSDTDSDESIRDFMERFMNCQEEIDQMWQASEDRLEKIYAIERLGEISNLKKGIMVCQENIRELHQKIEVEAASILSGIEEESTSFICIENDSDGTAETHVRFEPVDKNCTCCRSADETVVLENTTTHILSPISEEPDLELLETAELQAANSFETLPPIFDEQEFHSSYDDIVDEESDSRTMEFYSCQNSTSMKSCGDAEFTDSTFAISAEEISNSEKVYSADISNNNDTVSASSTIVYSSESGTLDANSISLPANVTRNLADISSDSSQAGNNEEVILEYMTHSYDTKEFIKLERACSTDDSNCADTMHFNSLLSNHVIKSENTVNGDHSDAHHSTFSHSSKEI
ncbi:hypothetical protein TSAR_014230 [Trichomalopsis sarcophagae]|uniref:Uncharacterized protein n=1 Tax=Trichomalopsis sarcophagae TaxID=543379 RepID=A0A232F9D1_9HYME|nr:hypothetical protein TSAR_014230 [Trichomalopsis sarcophagae]